MVRPLSEIPTLTLLYKLAHLTPPPPSSSLPTPSQKLNSLISLIRTDITTLEVSAIVNAANGSLLGGGGVDGAIHRHAGPGLFNECQRLNGCETGSAKITGAYDLPCEKVIHAVGPVYWSEKRKRAGLEKELLRGCYRKSLDLASENGCKSIAFSALSTGVYGYPSNEAAEEAIGEVRAWIDEKGESCGGLERIVFCCFEKKDEIAYTEWLPKYFPPKDQDVHLKTEVELIEAMPDPPTADPTIEGEPDTKKQKVAEMADDWEHVDKAEGSDVNGYKYSGTENDIRSTSIDEGAMSQEEKEQQTAALHTAQVGGDPPVNALGKDW